MPRQLVGRGVSTIRYDPERRALHRRLVRLRLDPGFRADLVFHVGDLCVLAEADHRRQDGELDPLRVASRKAQTGLNLPSYFELTKGEVQRIGSDVNEILKEMRVA